MVLGQREFRVVKDLWRLIDDKVPILAMMPIHGLHERSVSDEEDLASGGRFGMIADRTNDVVCRLAVDRPHSEIRPAFLELPDRLVDQIDGWLSDNELLARLCCTPRELNSSRRLTARERSGNPIECSH
jgi:hypothetical protein